MKRKEEVEIVRYYRPIQEGLNDALVKQRFKEKLYNKTKNKSNKSVASIFFTNIFTFFNLLWAIILTALIAVGAYSELLFIIVVILNTFVSIFQEIRAKITVERLSLVTVPKIDVVRNAMDMKVNADKLVLDDIIKLMNGSEVPADSIILEGEVDANESLLTGESNAIRKKPGDTIYAGSYLMSGFCYARVNKVGKDNYIQSIASEAKKFKSPFSNLFKDLNSLIKYIGIVIIPLGILMLLKEYFLGNSIADSVKNTSGSLTGMIPAGMYLLITIALAVGVVKLAKKRTLVQNLYSIEMLARSNVLCLDKTGTITDGTMQVQKVIPLVDNVDIGKIMAEIMGAHQTTNATSSAIVKEFGSHNEYPVKFKMEFSSERKCTVTTFDGLGSYIFGAAGFTRAKLSKEQKAVVAELAKKGYRVLVLAKSKEEILEEKIPLGNVPLAIFAIEDHIREDAIETIKWFTENGVQIKIISGDDPVAVSTIARKVGVKNSELCVSLENVSLTEVASMAEKFTVFGRVSPEQKQMIIKTLRNKGNTVAMTGDGVNDTLALKEADCSIAMAEGSAATRNLADLVLLDSKFSSLPSVVNEGRQVVNNVQNSSVLFLMKTIFTIILSLISLVTLTSYPLTPKQLFILEFFVIGLPSFILAFQPNSKLIKGEFIHEVIKKSFPRALLMVLNVLIIMLLDRFSVIDYAEANTLATLMVTLTGYINLLMLCLPFNVFRIICVSLSTVGIIFTTALMPSFFGMEICSSPVVITAISLTVISAILAVFIPKLFTLIKARIRFKPTLK